MEISAGAIKQLREETGVSVMLCRKALEDAGGDRARAKILLQRKGADAAAQKAGRSLGAGAIASYIHHGGTVGVLVELASETDFVAGNEGFRSLAHDIAMQIAAANPEFIRREDVSEDARRRAREAFAKEAEDALAGKGGAPADLKEKILQGKLDAYFSDKILLEQPFIRNPDLTVRNLIENAIQKFGEKIEVVRFARYAVGR